MAESQVARVRRRDRALRRWGRRSWNFVGIVAAVLVLHAGLSVISGLVIPLFVAVVVGMLFVPFTDRLERFVPRPVAAGLVMVALTAATVAVLVIAVGGVIDQAPEIGRRLGDGFEEVWVALDDLGLRAGDTDAVVDELADLWSVVVPGLTSYVGTVFSSTASFFAGTLVALFLLYFILADWPRLTGWVAQHLGVSEQLGVEIVDDATWAMRQYFLALTASSLVVAATVGIAAVILDLPLAFVITVVTFMTSYVPYLGAIFSGAFAVLIALGAGGFGDALTILVVVLVAQNVVQALVQTKLTEGRLSLHPIVIFGSTIAGGAAFGLLGAALSTPVVAIATRVGARLRDQDTPGASDAPLDS